MSPLSTDCLTGKEGDEDIANALDDCGDVEEDTTSAASEETTKNNRRTANAAADECGKKTSL